MEWGELKQKQKQQKQQNNNNNKKHCAVINANSHLILHYNTLIGLLNFEKKVYSKYQFDATLNI